MRKTYIDHLHKWIIGKNKGNINWKKCIGYKIKFIYDNINGYIKIVDYDDKYLYIKYLDNPLYKMKGDGLKKCQLGNILGIRMSDFRINIEQVFKDDKRDLVITDREHRKDKNNQDRKWYKYTCNKCGWTEGWIEEHKLLKGSNCACCANQIVVEGINDIPTTSPWMIPYFQGGYDEAKKYTKTSNKRIHPICPDCSRVKNNAIVVGNIFNNKSIGCNCGDKTPYPEKFIFSLLEQLGLNFISQLTRTTFKWCGNKRYDFYFKYNNEEYIIETHGEQHYEKGFKTCGGDSLEEEQANDRYKKELAIKNGVEEENYIVIDCRKSELEFVKENVMNSRLSEIFDLNKINWLKCEEFSLSNKIKQVCEYKRNNPNMSTIDIGKVFKLKDITIRRYLKQGTELGWCYYNAEEELIKSRRKIANSNKKRLSKPVEMFKNGKTLGVFYSASELERQSVELFGIKLLHKSIFKVCSGERKQYKGFYFEYIQTK